MLWIKSLHIISAVIWFSGIFYLPRLFVYHAMSHDTLSITRFKIMERKLFWGITTPGAIGTIFFGGWMLYGYAWQAFKSSGWLHVKLALIIILLIHHSFCGYYLQKFKNDNNKHGHLFYRFFNEIPVLMLFGIIIFAVVRPF